jgi:hypothetical protein
LIISAAFWPAASLIRILLYGSPLWPTGYDIHFAVTFLIIVNDVVQ